MQQPGATRRGGGATGQVVVAFTHVCGAGAVAARSFPASCRFCGPDSVCHVFVVTNQRFLVCCLLACPPCLCPDAPQDAEYIVAKAIRDGALDAVLDHAGGFLATRELTDLYSTNEPQVGGSCVAGGASRVDGWVGGWAEVCVGGGGASGGAGVGWVRAGGV